MSQDQFETQLITAQEQIRAGNSLDAERTYRGILREAPEHPGAHFGLGILLQNANAHEAALEHLQAATDSLPHKPESRFALAGSLFRVQRLKESAKHLEKIIHENPGIAEAHNLLGIVKAEMELNGPAERHFLKALRLRPDFPEAQKNLGMHYGQLGKLEEARDNLKMALARRPHYAEAWWQLASITKFTDYDDNIRSMEAAYRRDDATAPEKSQLAYALGKAFDDLQQHARAFEYWREGNDLRHKLSGYDVNPVLAEMRAMKRVFSATFRTTGDDNRNTSPALIFIVGMPRSGTSLTEQILASHSSVYGAGEIGALDDAIRGTVKRFPGDLRKLSTADWHAIRQRYLDEVASRAGNANTVTDKMPGNFLHIGAISSLFPGAKIIHCRRDALDTALSCYTKPFIHNRLNFTCDLTDLGRYCHHYLDLMAHWSKIQVPNIYDIQYETLVTDPEQEVRKLLTFCAMPFEAGCLAFHETARPVKTASAAQVRQPIYRDSVHSSQHYERELQPFKAALDTTPGLVTSYISDIWRRLRGS